MPKQMPSSQVWRWGLKMYIWYYPFTKQMPTITVVEETTKVEEVKMTNPKYFMTIYCLFFSRNLNASKRAKLTINFFANLTFYCFNQIGCFTCLTNLCSSWVSGLSVVNIIKLFGGNLHLPDLLFNRINKNRKWNLHSTHKHPQIIKESILC